MTALSSRRRLLRQVFFPLLAVISLLSLLMTSAIAAYSAPPYESAPPYDTEGTVSDIQFTTTEIQDGKTAEIAAKWSFPDNPSGTVGFTIELPPELAGQGDTFNLTDSGTGEPIATCVATAAELQCGFDPDYVKKNPIGLNGNVNFWVSVNDRVTTEQEKTYVIGEVEVTTIVKPRPKCTVDCELDFEYGKQGIYNATDHSILWYATIKAPEGGMAGGEEVSITDLVSDNQTLVKEKTALQYTNTTATNPDSGLVLPSNWEWVPSADRTVSSDGTTISFTAKEGYYYRAVYVTKANDFGAAGTYTNGVEFTVNGVKDGSATGEARYAGGGGSGVGTDVGVVTITKKVEGTATGLPSDQVFTGTYSVATPEGETLEGTWSTKDGGTWRSPDFPRDSTVTLTEDMPSDPENVTWTSEFSDSEFILPGGKVSPVTVTNTAKLKLASFTVEKTISGDAAALAPKDAEYLIDYEYPAGVGFEAGSGTLKVGADGTPVSSPELPVGAKIELSEQTPEAVSGASWGAPEISPASFTLVDGEVVAIKVDNPLSEVQSGFTLQKAITGAGADLVPGDAAFDVDYTWTASNDRSGEGTAKISADGTPVVVSDIPAGAVVTLSERAPEPVEGVTWQSPKFSQNEFTVDGTTTVEVEVENPTLLNTGTFSAVKSVTGTDGALALVPSDTEYTINYEYPAGAGFDAGEGSLTLLADGTAVASPELPYGAQVSISEETPEQIEGIAWQAPVITPATLAIGDGTEVAVTIENPVSETLGGFAIKKSISGDAQNLVPEGTVFTVDYAWVATDESTGSGTVEVRAGGEPEEVHGIPAGAVVTLTEQDPSEHEGVQWLDPIFSENGFTIVPGAVVSIDLDNPTALRQGAFSIQKMIDGSGKDLVDAETSFTVSYSYPAGEGFAEGSGTLEVKADGTAVQSEPLPYGAVVTLTEAEPGEVENGKWTGASFDDNEIVIGEGTVVNVILTNTIDDENPPTEEPTPPTEEPTPPTEEPTPPTEEPTAPTEEPTPPTEEPTVPTEEPTVPTEEPTVPTEEPTAPTEEPTPPTEEPTAPTEEPSAPTEEPTPPTEEPTAPTEEPTAPTEEPTAPTEESGKPTKSPEQPGEPSPKPKDKLADTGANSALWILAGAGLGILAIGAWITGRKRRHS